MAYLDSENVIVFPLAKERTQSIQETRLLTEFNVSNIIRQLMGNRMDGFIISSTDVDGGKQIEFNIYGYYFKIKITTEWLGKNFKNDCSVYASIELDNTVDEIIGQDEDLTYRGLKIISESELDSNSTDRKIISIKLFDIISNTQGREIKITPSKFINTLIGGIDGKYR